MTTPKYNPNVPQYANNNLAQTQKPFLDNFLSLYNIFSVNHVPLDAGSTAGNHTIIQTLEQETSHQTDLGEISIYTKNVEDQTDQIFMRYQGNGQEFQYINYQIYSITNIPNQTSYFTFLPGKIVVFFGNFTSLPNNTLILYPPIAKSIMGMSFCPIGNTSSQGIKPQVNLLPQENGAFIKMLVRNGTFFNQPAPSCSYIVMANA